MIDSKKIIQVARGEAPADLCIENVQLINVLSGEIHQASVSCVDSVVAALEPCEARETIDAQGRWLCPGLIEGHIHIESTLLSPPQFLRVAASHGTAMVFCDPHEIANVLGAPGVQWMLDVTAGLPVDVRVMMSSCVPATGLEDSGATLSADDVARFLKDNPKRMPGLAEMMNFPGVLFQDPQVLAKLEAARDRVIDGHAPGLGGRDLSAYIAAGPASDHETTRIDEAREKLRKGIHLMLREGSHEHNMLDLLPAVTEFNAQNCSLVSDDRHPDDLLRKGHLDHSIRLAIGAGVPAVRAIQMASINTARYFGVRRRGAIAPGYRADFMLLDDLQSFNIQRCFLGAKDVATLGFSSTVPVPGNSMHLAGTPSPEQFRIQAKGQTINTIGVIPDQIVTQARQLPARIEQGLALADASRDLAKIAVMERHHGTGNIGLGFVQGLGLRRGAIASTVAHDSHNLIVAGLNDDDMALAAKALTQCAGGFAVACDGAILAQLPLPIAGLMSPDPAEAVVARLDELNAQARRLMDEAAADPFMILSFLALPVIPSLKLTDKGLVDVDRFEFTPLFTTS